MLGRGNRQFLWVAPDGMLVAFSHEPLTLGHVDYPHNDFGWDVNVHGHVHANGIWDPQPGKRYVNACVEKTDYAPIRVWDILSRS